MSGRAISGREKAAALAVGVVIFGALLWPHFHASAPAPASPALPPGWVFQATAPARGEAQTDAGGGVHVHVTAPGRSFWQAQLYQDAIPLADGHTYAVSFEARAGRPCDLPVNSAQAAPPYQWTGLVGHAALGTDWRAFRYEFTARGTHGGKSRCPAFGAGNKAGDYWIRRVSVAEIKH